MVKGFLMIYKHQFQLEFMNKILKNKSGSALLVSILIMAVLLIVGLGINRLIVNELRIERNLIAGGQAYYAAEGASELALLDIKANLAGYEGDYGGDMGNGAEYAYEIFALGEIWPCDIYGEKVYEDENTGDLWRVLEVEESVMVALFSDDGEDITEMEGFRLDYALEMGFEGMLRWKILGIAGNGLTEAISDYEEVYGGQFGYFYANNKTSGYYDDLGESWGGRQYVFVEEYNVADFLREHDYNYLILTNNSEEDVDLRVKLSEGDNDFVCEYVGIEADGLNGELVQQIDVFVKEGEPLPVFDFVLWEKEN